MSKKDESRPIRAKLQFRKNKVEHWFCDNREQLTEALKEDREATGRVPLSVNIRVNKSIGKPIPEFVEGVEPGKEVCHE